MNADEMAVFEYRLARSDQFRALRDRANKADILAQRHEEQISGDGGLQKTLHELKEDFRDVRRALYALTTALILVTVAVTTLIASHA